jgi:4-amino-4-deoxy-L-arabinose transferase-like glycosyltransferase
MATVGLRVSIFTFVPLLLAGALILVDRSVSSRERRLETVLVFLFAIGVAGAGISNFIAHFFLSDIVAESIGWEAGSPFQLEVAFANLAIGALGLVATSRRDGFREATVVAATVFAFGASMVHVMDIVATGNLAPGNTLQNVANLLRPALLIGFLVAMRRVEASHRSEAWTVEFERWRRPLLQASAPVTMAIATAYGVGFAVGQPLLLTLVGVLVSAVILAFVLIQSPWHGQEQDQGAGGAA